MKVKYIGKTMPLERTHGQTYAVLAVEKGWYRIEDDTGEDYLYPPDVFERMEDQAAKRKQGGFFIPKFALCRA